MMTFLQMWQTFAIGSELTVTDGTKEPSQAGPERNAWRSHNFTGTIVAKTDGITKSVDIKRINSLGNEVTYTIVDGGTDRFAYSANSPMAAMRMDAELDLNARRNAALAAALTDGEAIKFVYTLKADEVKRASGLLAAALNAILPAVRAEQYPMANGEMQVTGETLAQVIARYRAGYAAAIAPIALIEGRAQAAKRSAKVASTYEQANSAKNATL